MLMSREAERDGDGRRFILVDSAPSLTRRWSRLASRRCFHVVECDEVRVNIAVLVSSGDEVPLPVVMHWQTRHTRRGPDLAKVQKRGCAGEANEPRVHTVVSSSPRYIL